MSKHEGMPIGRMENVVTFSSSFSLRASLVIRHSDFVISRSAFSGSPAALRLRGLNLSTLFVRSSLDDSLVAPKILRSPRP
jgi:hypothetical protein